MAGQGEETTTAAVPEATAKCKMRKKRKMIRHLLNAEKNGTEKQEEAVSVVVDAVLTSEGTPESKEEKGKANERLMAGQEEEITTAAVPEGTVKCKRRKKRKRINQALNAKENGTVEQEEAVSVVADAVLGTPELKEEEGKANERLMAGQGEETTTAAVPEGTAKCKMRKKRKRIRHLLNAEKNGTEKQEEAVSVVADAVLTFEGTPELKEEKGKENERLMAGQEEETTTAAVPEGTVKCKRRKKRKRINQVLNAKENGTVKQEEAVSVVVDAVLGTPELKEEEGKANDRLMAGQGEETTTAAVPDIEGTLKCSKKKKKKKAREAAVDEPEVFTVISALEGAPEPKKEEEEEGKALEMVMVGQEEEATATIPVSDIDGTRKCKKKKKKKKAREASVDEPAVSTVISGAPEPKKEEEEEGKAHEIVMAGQEEEATATIPVSEMTLKCKNKKKKKANEAAVAEPEVSTAISGASESKKDEEEEGKAQEIVMAGQEEEATATTAVSDLQGPLKCKKKKKKKKKNKDQEAAVGEPEASTVISVEGTKIHEVEGENGHKTGLAEQETTAAVSEAEVPRQHKRRKKNKMQKQQESTPTLSGLVAVDVANKPENGGTNGEGSSGVADVSMDPINTVDPCCSIENDADDKVNSETQDKNCSEELCSFQEGSEDRKRETKREKGKLKRDASHDISLQDGDTDSNPCLDSSCLVSAHEDKVNNFFSPRGSLVRFKRKKLLILDLNGLLADITMDRQNEHLAHAKVKGKLVFRRPYYDDFLRFCFQHFELGVWSSRKMENVNSVVDILMQDLKHYLLFCWDMSKCTFTGCKVIGDQHKPLVLKELKKLWNKEDPYLPWEQGEFSPSNTLLVDDSPYKALCNPPHTAIFPQPYSYLNQRDDYSLGPGGDLRVYLERLAAADDVQVFVRDNPFGQPSITESDPQWNFYSKIVQRVEQGRRLSWYQCQATKQRAYRKF